MNNEDFKKSWKEELDKFKPSVDDEQYQFLDVGSCDCVFSTEEIEKLVALCDEDGYLVPRGLTREEKRMFINEVGRPKYLLTKEQVRKIGEHSLRKYAETSPSDFKVEDFIDLTNESDKGDIVVDL